MVKDKQMHTSGQDRPGKQEDICDWETPGKVLGTVSSIDSGESYCHRDLIRWRGRKAGKPSPCCTSIGTEEGMKTHQWQIAQRLRRRHSECKK